MTTNLFGFAPEQEAKFGYARHSPSALNLFAASPAMFVLERVLGKKQPVGAPAHRGSAVEDGVTMGLNNMRSSIPSCVNVALTKYDTLTALSSDPRNEKYREMIPPMVKTALEELRKYGAPSDTQGEVCWAPDDLKLPIVGFYDYAWDKKGHSGRSQDDGKNARPDQGRTRASSKFVRRIRQHGCPAVLRHAKADRSLRA